MWAEAIDFVLTEVGKHNLLWVGLGKSLGVQRGFGATLAGLFSGCGPRRSEIPFEALRGCVWHQVESEDETFAPNIMCRFEFRRLRWQLAKANHCVT
jgi:hypothetical protein